MRWGQRASTAPTTATDVAAAATDVEWFGPGSPIQPDAAAGDEPEAAPGDDADEHTPGRARDDGRSRRRRALAVIAVAVGSAVAGVVVGGRLQSPADRAAGRQPPRASRITVPVVRRTLSSRLTLSGEISYAEPTPVKLAGAVGIAADETAVITRLPTVAQEVAEGDVLLEVSGRPVLVLQGELPTYRSLGPGAVGADVQQLEAALQRLGLDPGPVDTTYDTATEAAVERLYVDAGYTAVGPSADEDDRLRAVRQAVTDAENTVRDAQNALDQARETATGATLLGLQQAVDQARNAVAAAEQQAQRNNDAAAATVAGATAARDAAIGTRDATKLMLETATTPGAVDPATGAPYTSDEIETRRVAAGEAQAALSAAETEVTAAETQRAATAAEGTASIGLAKDARALAEAQLADGTTAPDTTAQQRALDDATARLSEATVELTATEEEIGIRIPAGELAFVPALPSQVTSVEGAVGAAPSADGIVTVSSSATQIIGRVSRADAGLVAVGNQVTVEVRDADASFAGTIESVGDPPASGDSSSGSGGGRRQVIVTPDDASALADYVFSSVRIVVDIDSTGGEVLVVPNAAVSVGGDGTSRVEVEDTPITAGGDGSTRFVEVEVGLSADGMVAITPRGAALDEGDRIVVGTEAG